MKHIIAQIILGLFIGSIVSFFILIVLDDHGWKGVVALLSMFLILGAVVWAILNV